MKYKCFSSFGAEFQLQMNEKRKQRGAGEEQRICGKLRRLALKFYMFRTTIDPRVFQDAS